MKVDQRELLTSRHEKYYQNSAWAGFNELFAYDNAGRLTSSRIGSGTAQTISYYQGSKIDRKSDVGDYYYSGDKTQVSSIYSVSGYAPGSQTLTYGSNNRLASITEGMNAWAYEYDAEDLRSKATLKKSNVLQKTRYYFDNYEKEITASNGVISQIDYIFADNDLVALRKKNEFWWRYHVLHSHRSPGFDTLHYRCQRKCCSASGVRCLG